MTVNVIFRKTAEVKPCVQFYSMPVSVLGGGDSVDDATARFSEALADAVDSDVSPPFDRHVEIDVADLPGFYIRMAMSESDFEDRENRMAGVNELIGALAGVSSDAIDHFNSAQAASGDVVLVIAQPSDTMGWVFDQMTPFDSLWLALNSSNHINFVALHGGRAIDRDAESGRPIDPDEVRDKSIAEVLGKDMSREVASAGQLTMV